MRNVTNFESLSDPFSAIRVPSVESSTTEPTTSLASGTASTRKNLNSNFAGAEVVSPSETTYESSSPLLNPTSGV